MTIRARDVREEDAPTEVFKQLKKPLWDEMLNVISDGGRKETISLGNDAQESALAQVDVELEGAVAIPGGQRS